MLRLSNHSNGRGPSRFHGIPAPAHLSSPRTNTIASPGLRLSVRPEGNRRARPSAPPVISERSRGISKPCPSQYPHSPVIPAPQPAIPAPQPAIPAPQPAIPAPPPVIPAPEPESIPGIQPARCPRQPHYPVRPEGNRRVPHPSFRPPSRNPSLASSLPDAPANPTTPFALREIEGPLPTAPPVIPAPARPSSRHSERSRGISKPCLSPNPPKEGVGLAS